MPSLYSRIIGKSVWFYTVNEEEPAQNAPQTEEQKLSKSALKNKKKREAKNKGKPGITDNRSAEQRSALATASFILSEPTPAPAVGVDVEAEKKIKALRKVRNTSSLYTHGKMALGRIFLFC
eukprot:XP_011670572.1 PREDICTED: eukaryotic translation initiation factor 2A-like [Strongylocentrotus purpuratus]